MLIDDTNLQKLSDRGGDQGRGREPSLLSADDWVNGVRTTCGDRVDADRPRGGVARQPQ